MPGRAPFGRQSGPPKPPRPPGRTRGASGGGNGFVRFLIKLRWLWITLAILIAIGVGVAVGGGFYVWNKYLADVPPLPDRATLYAVNRAPGIRFEDKDGELITTRGPRYGEQVKIANLPPHVYRAFLAAEDRRYFEHGALDFKGIGRAAWINFRAGRVVQGGSTITQQLAKGLFLTPDQNMKRKLQEALMAHRLQKVMSKDEILELYLNRIFFGANTFGIDGASRSYFGKSAKQLTIAESALLASLPKAPSRLALTRNMDGALERSRLVLGNMYAEGWITSAQYQTAVAERPTLVAKASKTEGDIGYALDYATAEAVRIAGANAPDLIVQLTIDPKLQKTAAGIVRDVLNTDGARSGASQGSMIILDTDGAIRVLVGGKDYDASPFNRAVQAKRQPGSTFKPFVYAAALEKGVLPTDTRVDAPLTIGNWSPQNYGGGYRGTVTVETALAQSINTVAARLGQEVGGPAIGELARRFGLASIPPRPDLSVSLGSYEVNLLELVSGFQVFQQGGRRVQPYIVKSVRTLSGETLYERGNAGAAPVYDTTLASMMVRMLNKVVVAGTGTRANIGRPMAGKTGTSQNWRDAWFIGFTPDYVGGVWLGNDNDKPMARVAGGTLPAVIWNRVMTAAHKDLPVRDFDWLTDAPVRQTEPDPRNPFYQGLADDFGRAAEDSAPPPQDLPPPPEALDPPEGPRAPPPRRPGRTPPPPPPEEQIPY